jgi:hypothetical protein
MRALPDRLRFHAREAVEDHRALTPVN